MTQCSRIFWKGRGTMTLVMSTIRLLRPLVRPTRFKQSLRMLSSDFTIDDYWEYRKSMEPDLAMSYKDFNVTVKDIDAKKLEDLGAMVETPSLSSAPFPSPAFPVTGKIYSVNDRLMVPLICQKSPPLRNQTPEENQEEKGLVVWFLVHTGSPFTCISPDTVKAIFGDEREIREGGYYNLKIQDPNANIQCNLSKNDFKEVNILGVDAMRKLKLSISIDWKQNEFQLVRN